MATVEILRRWFLFGSAAAVAAASLPTEAKPIRWLRPTPVVAPHDYLLRRISAFTVGFDADAPEGAAEITMWVRGQPILQFAVSTKSCLHWSAPPGGEIILRDRDTFSLEVKAQAGVGRIQMCCADVIDDGPPVEIVETHKFPQTAPSTINYLHVDNSLSARRARALARPMVNDSDDDYEVDLWES